MKLTELQIEAISRYLEKDKIFYDDIRYEMLDHIATTLEEHIEQTGEDFDVILKAYMHSHQKVKLLTAVRGQEQMRDRQYRNLIFRQLVSKKGLIIFAVFYGVIAFSTFSLWIYRFFEIPLMLIALYIMLEQPGLQKRFPFVKRIYEVSTFFLLGFFPIIFFMHKVTDETQLVLLFKAVLLSIFFTCLYLLFKLNSQLQKKTYA